MERAQIVAVDVFELLLRQKASRQEIVVQLVRVPWVWPFFLADTTDGRGIQRSEIARPTRFSSASRIHGIRPSFLERRVIQKCVRPRVEDLVREWRRFGRVARDTLDLAVMNALEDRRQRLEVHRFLQAVTDGLRHQGMIRNLAITWDVLETRGGVWEHCSHEVVRLHAL